MVAISADMVVTSPKPFLCFGWVFFLRCAAYEEHVGKQVIVSGIGKGVLEYYGQHKASGAVCAGVAMEEPVSNRTR